MNINDQDGYQVARRLGHYMPEIFAVNVNPPREMCMKGAAHGHLNSKPTLVVGLLVDPRRCVRSMNCMERAIKGSKREVNEIRATPSWEIIRVSNWFRSD